jgi:hypothetical protein
MSLASWLFGHLIAVGYRLRGLREDDDVLRSVRPDHPRLLPQRFDAPHAVAFFLHDELASLAVHLESIDALNVSFELEPGEERAMARLEGEDLWEWLVATGRDEVVGELTYRQVTAAVLSDAAHFLCESLLASAKGKTTVAYSLLRKPFKESLLIMEWLCAEPDDFLEKFHGESVRPYVLNRLPEDQRRHIMRTASALVDLPGMSDELLWTIRYAKEYENSLETLWTQATHLVTTVRASATEPGNLNFVFSGESAREEQWEHYYHIVPLLLHYFVAVAEQVISRFVEWDSAVRSSRDLFRSLAFFRYVQSTSGMADLRDTAEETFRELGELGFSCSRCGADVQVSTSGVDRFWLRAEMVCPRCRRRYDMWEVLGDSSETPLSQEPRETS